MFTPEQRKLRKTIRTTLDEDMSTPAAFVQEHEEPRKRPHVDDEEDGAAVAGSSLYSLSRRAKRRKRTDGTRV